MTRVKNLSIMLVFSLGVAVLSSCRPQKKEEAASETFGAAPVKVFKVKKQRISEKLFYTGTLEAWQRINITPDTGGKIARIYVNEGDRVAKGQVLAELDTQAIELQLKQAEAAFAVAQARYNDSRTNLDRMERLFKEKAVSDQQYEQVRLAFDASKAQLDQAQAAVNLARHSLNVAIMKAPFSGIIASKNADVGDVINPMMGAFSGGSGGVLTLVDFSRIKIRVDVSPSEITRVKKGQPAILRVPSLPEHEFRGTITVINLAADPLTKKFGVEVAVDNPDLVLRPGTFGEIAFEISTHEDALVVPQKAILSNKYLFVVEDGKAVKREVVLGLQNATMVEITSGLAEGDEVIVEGNFGLEEGATVNIIGEVKP
ncbi:MAG: efflux RND transporter periplasmic adaptor subunit [Clostridiales bacterium]|nr:efflux RND transporter periplasmic adaptor subunit [Clostridiales bacterium]